MKDFTELSATAERVVDVAEELVQHHGYNGFSYDDIAQRVGIRKPSIHHHFRTKSELVTVVAQRYTQRFKGLLVSVQARHASAVDRLHAYAALFESTFAQDRRLCVCGMLGAEADTLPPEVQAEVTRFFQANLDWLEHVIVEGQRLGQLRIDAKAAALAELFLCSLEGSMVVGRGVRAAVGPRSVAQAAVLALLPG